MHKGSPIRHRRATTTRKTRRAAFALPFAILLLASPAASQIVTGQVLNAGNDQPVGSVTLLVIDTSAVTRAERVSNAAGEFFIPLTEPGTCLLRAQRVAYATAETAAFEIEEGEVIEVELRLAADSAVSQPLKVIERRRETRRERDLREFYERAEYSGEPHVGSRQIYTRDGLADWDALSVRDLFAFHVRWRPFGSGCDPKVFLDGRLLYGPFLEDIGFMSVSNLEGIELYAGGGPERSRFWDPAGCGVVLVWTRAVREGGGRRLGVFEVVALVGAVGLLVLQGIGLLF